MAQTNVFLDYGLPSLNDVIREAKKHPMAYAKMKKDVTKMVEADLVTSGCVPERVYDMITISFIYGETKKKRDPDNITVAQKFVLDAMVNVKMIPDDSREHVLSLNHNFTGAPQAKRSVRVSWRAGYYEPE